MPAWPGVGKKLQFSLKDGKLFVEHCVYNICILILMSEVGEGVSQNPNQDSYELRIRGIQKRIESLDKRAMQRWAQGYEESGKSIRERTRLILEQRQLAQERILVDTFGEVPPSAESMGEAEVRQTLAQLYRRIEDTTIKKTPEEEVWLKDLVKYYAHYLPQEGMAHRTFVGDEPVHTDHAEVTEAPWERATGRLHGGGRKVKTRSGLTDPDEENSH